VRLDLSRRTDGELLREFSGIVFHDRRSTAEMVSYIGEIQRRKLFRAKGYSSMYLYCVQAWRMSEHMAWKRIRVATVARRFPVVLDMIADGRLHVSAVVQLSPHRESQAFPELLKAAVHRTRAEIELLLAERFPQPDQPTEVRPLMVSAPRQGMAPGPVEPTHVESECGDSGPAGESQARGACETVPDGPGTPEQSESPTRSVLPMNVPVPAERARVRPLAPQRFAIQVTVGQATHDKLRRAQDLLGHQVAPGDLEQVLDRALDCLIRQLEHQKFAATERPRRARSRSTEGKRHVPAHVKRAVYQRDGGQCTFVGDSGRRCDERRDLEYDHVEPFARGGEATVAGLRLLCRTHNQFEAERTYGAGFMDERREQARSTAAAGRPSRCGAGPPV
jgi:5-methylcytosine-specific restriction endonuclease McrA